MLPKATEPIGAVHAAVREAAAREFKRTIRLTSRWTPLKPNPYQSTYYWHPAPVKINPSGRRSGKTELAKRKVPRELIRKRPWPARLLCGAPTHDQAKAIFWDDLKLLIPKHWILRINESELIILTRWGAYVKVAGFDKPQRHEGIPWDWMVVDEMADCPRDFFNLNMMPALATLGRGICADLIGVPDEAGRNQAEYEKLWESGLKWRPGKPPVDSAGRHAFDPDICSFHWSSDQILEPEKIEKLRARMSRQQFEQEMGGRFMRSGGKVVPDFDSRTGGLHVSERVKYNSALPLDWSMDFGTNPAASLICQSAANPAGGRDIFVLDEVVVSPGGTPASVREFLSRVAYGGYGTHLIRIFGDAAGKHPHSPVGVSDYEVVEHYMQAYNVDMMNLDVNPPIIDTVNALRMVAMDANGLVRLHIHPRCEMLIENLKSAPWPDKDRLQSFHCLAALRYYVYTLHEDNDQFAVLPLVSGNLGNPTNG